MEVEELVTKFEADISDYRKKMEQIKSELNAVSGITDNVKKVTQKALSSNSTEVQKYGKQLQGLINTQTKQSQSAFDSAKRLEDYREKAKLLVSQLNQQKEEIHSLSEALHSLNNLYVEQQSLLNDFDGIEGVRKHREEITETLQNASAASEKIQKKLDELKDTGFKDNDATVKVLTNQLSDYSNQIKRAKNDLAVFDEELKTVGLKPENLKTDTLESLKKQMQSVTSQMRQYENASQKTNAQIKSTNGSILTEKQRYNSLKGCIEQNAVAVNSLRKRILSLGRTNAASKLKNGFNGVRGVLNRVGSIAGSAFNKVRSGLSSARTSAGTASKSMLNVVKSIKRIGLASLGLKAAKAVFGGLRSAVSSCLSQNEQLNSRVESLKNAFSSALAPAIGVVIGLFEKLMPYALSVANAISDLFSSLGIASSIKETSTAINGTTDATNELSEAQKDLYGFDKITKVGDDSSNSNSSDNKNSSAPSASSQFSKYLEEIKSLWKNGDFEGIGEQIASSCNKVIKKINNLDWDGIQTKVSNSMSGIARSLNGFVKNFDWQGAGEIVGKGINTVFSGIDSFLSDFDFKSLGQGFAKNFNGIFKTVDFKKIGKTISDIISGLFDTISGFFETLDWSGMARKLEDLIKGIDFGKMSRSFFESLGAAFGGVTSFFGQLLVDAFRGINKYFKEQIEACGGDVGKGILKGIGDAFISIGNWIRSNILDPFVNGFKKAFEIHSPSKVMQRLGGYLMDGLKKGITDAKDNLKRKWDDVKGWFSDIKKKVSLSVATKWSDLKTKWNNLLTNFKDKTVNINAKIGAVKEGIKEWINTKFIAPVNAKISWLGIELPRLATGGVVDKPTIAQIGENGREAVIPLENNTGWIANLARQIVQLTSSNSGGVLNITLPISIGNHHLTTVVLKNINKDTKLTKNMPVQV